MGFFKVKYQTPGESCDLLDCQVNHHFYDQDGESLLGQVKRYRISIIRYYESERCRIENILCEIKA